MNICVAGKNNIAVDVCEYILQHYENVVLYAIHNSNDDGVDNWQRSFRKYASEHPKIQLTTLESVYNINDLVFISTEYDKIIKPNLFRSTRLYNIHFSLLPAYKGMYTAALPILYGESYTGVTLHCIDSGIDTGDIIDQTKIRIANRETAYSLYHKFLEKGTNLVIKNIDKLLQGNFTSYPQSSKGSSYYSKQAIDYSNLSINLNCTAQQIDQQIRAYYFPVYQIPVVHNTQIGSAKILKSKSKQKSGYVLKETDEYILLSTIDYDMKLFKVK